MTEEDITDFFNIINDIIKCIYFYKDNNDFDTNLINYILKCIFNIIFFFSILF